MYMYVYKMPIAPECLVDVYTFTPHFLECIARNIIRDGFCTKLNISEEMVHMFQEWSRGTYQPSSRSC